MKRPTPIDAAVEFRADEMFYSATDKRGIITSGNSVFQRISGYASERLIGAPHNINRHPDMPKAVFKLLWDTVGADQPICAYVKNLAADGRYYWVFATVFPTPSGYLSVRVKPSTPLFDAARAVYPKMVEAEKNGGIEAAQAVLLELLGKAGFDGYGSFMTQALVAELGARIKALSKPDEGVSAAGLVPVFNELPKLTELKSHCANASGQLQSFFSGLRSLSINMSLTANHLGKAANTLVIISEAFQRFSSAIQSELRAFFDNVKPVQDAITRAEYYVSAALLMTQMADYFTKETEGGGAVGDARAEIALLRSVALTQCQAMEGVIFELRDRLLKLAALAGGMDSSITTLEIVRQTGSVESEQVIGASATMSPYLNGIRKIVSSLRGPIRGLSETSASLARTCEGISERVAAVKSQPPEFSKAA